MINLATVKAVFEAAKTSTNKELLREWADCFGLALIEEIERLRRALKVKRLSNFERAKDIIKSLAKQYETNQWPDNESEVSKQIILASKLMDKDFDGGDYSG